MVESDRPTCSVGGVSLWHYLSKPSEELAKNGQPKFKGGIPMVLLEVSTQDGKKRYTAMSVENLNLLCHNAAGVLGCAKGLKDGIAKAEAKAKADAEAKAKADQDGAAKLVPTLKAAGCMREAIRAALTAQFASLTLESADALIPADIK